MSSVLVLKEERVAERLMSSHGTHQLVSNTTEMLSNFHTDTDTQVYPPPPPPSPRTSLTYIYACSLTHIHTNNQMLSHRVTHIQVTTQCTPMKIKAICAVHPNVNESNLCSSDADKSLSIPTIPECLMAVALPVHRALDP